MIKHIGILLVFLSSSLCAQTLTVIYDSGDTLPIVPYLSKSMEQQSAREATPEKAITSLFPVVSPSLSPGIVEPKAMSLQYLQSPIFVIGYDNTSLIWLKKYTSRLKEIGAVGMVVSVDSIDQFNEIKNSAKDIEFIPASGEGIHSFLGLDHYPVLITKQGFEQ